jgi:uncharacterized protein
MIIDLQAVSDETRVHEVMDREWWQSDPGEQILGFASPLVVNVKVSKAADKFLLDGSLSGLLKVRCDRCLKPFDFELNAKFHVYLAVSPSGPSEGEMELLDEDMEVEFIRGETIELDDVVREQVYLAVPMKCICKSDCQGLCPQCGSDLNAGLCSCRSAGGHPAFYKLSLLKSQGE